MLTLIERLVSSEHDLVVLAPSASAVPRFFRNVPDGRGHSDLLHEVQRLRGSVYLADGAIQASQLVDGRHQTPEDDRAWHLLILDNRRVAACIWYDEHQNIRSIDQMRVRDCPLVELAELRDAVRRAVQIDICRARREGLQYSEAGGWAVAPSHRRTGEGLLLALAAFSLANALGGALCLTTATVRHASSVVLRRLGGAPLEVDGRPVPTYYDPRYGCDMELLRFESRKPNPKYRPLVDLLMNRLATVPVIARADEASPAAATGGRADWRQLPATGGAAA